MAFKCDNCGFEFTRRDNLYRHLRTQHNVISKRKSTAVNDVSAQVKKGRHSDVQHISIRMVAIVDKTSVDIKEPLPTKKSKNGHRSEDIWSGGKTAGKLKTEPMK